MNPHDYRGHVPTDPTPAPADDADFSRPIGGLA